MGPRVDWGGGDLLPRLWGARVSGVQRRGKLLLLHFDSGVSLVIHLMLLGQALLIQAPPPAESAIAMTFSDGTAFIVKRVAVNYQHLVERDRLEELGQLAELGPDVLSPEFTLEQLKGRLAGRRGAIKPLLMDQSIVAGLGNTYADEVLFAARLHPQRDVRSLSEGEIEAILEAILSIMEKSVSLGGAGIDNVVRLDGSRGSFQEHFQVARREGEPCYVCSTPVAKMKLKGRSTYFCPQCQH